MKEQEGNKIMKFDIRKMPNDLLYQCIDIMYCQEMIDYLKSIEDKDDFYAEIEAFVYLAWLGANDLLILDGALSGPAEGYDFEPEPYQDEENGYNPELHYHFHNMEKCIPLLKGKEF